MDGVVEWLMYADAVVTGHNSQWNGTAEHRVISSIITRNRHTTPCQLAYRQWHRNSATE